MLAPTALRFPKRIVFVRMMSSQKFSRNRTTLTYRSTILLGVGASATTAFVLAKKSLKENVDDSILPHTFLATFRILNLCYTVGSVCLDYGYFMYFEHRNDNTKYDILTKQLKRAQNELTTYSSRLAKNQEPNNESKEKLIALTKSSYAEMNRIGRELATLNDDEKVSRLSEVHTRNAIRLRNLCAENRGVYIKLGQHLAQLDYLLPTEYITVLRTLLASSPQSSYESVRRVIFEDFGKYPEELWEKFDQKPIASASLAQVHIAYDKFGQKYAVKVQHDGLLESSEGDMKAITLAIELVSKLFPQFTYTWLSREMNRNLPLELDFINEANNLKECTNLFNDLILSGDIDIPKVFRVSKRVLWMSFEEGAHISDISYIKTQGIPTADVSRLISQIFCEQMFRHGFVHCDPHEANLLVRPHPRQNRAFLGSVLSTRPQVVLLDHGLYRKLDDDFRRAYCRLWSGIVRGDAEEIRRCCLLMGTEDDIEAYSLLAAALVMKPWEQIVKNEMSEGKKRNSKGLPGVSGVDEDDQKEIIKAYAQHYFAKMMGMLGSLPSSLLLLLKTNDCLRHIDKLLGTPINTAAVVATITTDVIFMENLRDSKTYREAFNTIIKYSTAKLRAILITYYGRISWWLQQYILVFNFRLYNSQ